MVISSTGTNRPPLDSQKGLVRILVDSFADEGLPNAQMTNAREIIRRLDPATFHVSVFHLNKPDPAVAARPNTRLIPLPRRRQTIRILQEFLLGRHQILFYVKSSPATKLYMQLRRQWKDNRVVLGTIESQCDFRNEPTITAENVALWERTILRSDFLYSNSPAVRRSLQAEYGKSSDIVPTGVDTKFFTPPLERASNSRPGVLFVGSLRPFKQPHLLLEAAVRFPFADFVIAGDGMMAQQLQNEIARRNLKNVMLAGPLGAHDLRKQYQTADIFLFPSQWEGSPKVILEAAACGLPVIARVNYEPETVINNLTGYLVASDEELFSRLRQLLESPELRLKLGKQGRHHSEKFDWDLITRQWEEIFLRVSSRQLLGRAA